MCDSVSAMTIKVMKIVHPNHYFHCNNYDEYHHRDIGFIIICLVEFDIKGIKKESINKKQIKK